MDILIIGAAKYLFAVVIVASLIIGLRHSGSVRKEYICSLLIAGLIAIVVMKLSNQIISSPRPFVVGHFTPLIPHAADNGFPSDHTAIATLFALAVWPWSRRWSWLLLGLAVIVGAARVAAGVHHPLDIAGAIGITWVASLAGWFIVRHWIAEPKKNPSTNHRGAGQTAESGQGSER